MLRVRPDVAREPLYIADTRGYRKHTVRTLGAMPLTVRMAQCLYTLFPNRLTSVWVPDVVPTCPFLLPGWTSPSDHAATATGRAKRDARIAPPSATRSDLVLPFMIRSFFKDHFYKGPHVYLPLACLSKPSTPIKRAGTGVEPVTPRIAIEYSTAELSRLHV